MKRVRKYLTSLSLFFILAGCNLTNKEKVLLIGTVHESTPKLNADSIYSILLKFKPDLILIELDSTFFYEDFTFKTLFNGNEMVATTRYKMNFPSVQIRPIEFEGREEYRDKIGVFPEITQEFSNILQQLHTSKIFTKEENYSINRLLYFDSLTNILKAEKISIINGKKVNKIVDSLNYYKYVKLKEISDKYPEFSLNKMIDSKNDTVSVKHNFDLYVDFEMNKRNNALANNSLEIIKNNPNKKIIILVGFAHKSYIQRFLNEKGIKLKYELLN